MGAVELEGDKAVKAALLEFPVRFTKKALRKTLRDAMKQIVFSVVKSTIAVLSGRMRTNVKVRSAKGKGGKRLPRGMFGIAVQVAESVHYAKWVLMNRKLRSGRIRKGDRTLRNALYDNKQRLNAYVTSHMRKALPQIAAEVKAKTKAKG